MTTPPKKPEFETPDQMLQRILWPVAAKLLAQDPLLLFDGASGNLISANEPASLAPGLDLPLPPQPTFAEMLAGGQEHRAMLWPFLTSGNMRSWTGLVTGAPGLICGASLSGRDYQ